MWPDKASLNIQTHGQYHALKMQVLVMLVSRNVFHVVSALQSIGSIHFWLIRSLVAPTLAGLSYAVPCSLSYAIMNFRTVFLLRSDTLRF